MRMSKSMRIFALANANISYITSIYVISDVPQGGVLGPLLFLLYIADLPALLQNVLVSYADDSTLFCRIPHPRDRASTAAILNDDLALIRA